MRKTIVIDNKKMKYESFINDKEKMEDFKLLSKKDFLKSYSYLSEIEYNLTIKEAKKALELLKKSEGKLTKKGKEKIKEFKQFLNKKND